MTWNFTTIFSVVRYLPGLLCFHSILRSFFCQPLTLISHFPPAVVTQPYRVGPTIRTRNAKFIQKSIFSTVMGEKKWLNFETETNTMYIPNWNLAVLYFPNRGINLCLEKGQVKIQVRIKPDIFPQFKPENPLLNTAIFPVSNLGSKLTYFPGLFCQVQTWQNMQVSPANITLQV